MMCGSDYNSLSVCLIVCSVYKDGVEVYNMTTAGQDVSCVVGDKLSCELVLDDDKQTTVYFIKNNTKVH